MAQVEEVKALTDAIRIIRDSRCVISNGPIRPWTFLNHAEGHLQDELDQIAAPVMDEIFGDPDQYSGQLIEGLVGACERAEAHANPYNLEPGTMAFQSGIDATRHSSQREE
jgi:hypothetical protein